MNLNYSKKGYNKLINILEEYGFPYNDTLIEIFYQFGGLEINNFNFYFKNNNNEIIKDSINYVLSFNRKNSKTIVEVMDKLVGKIEGEFYPFAISENGNCIGIYLSEFEEEIIQVYIEEEDNLYRIID